MAVEGDAVLTELGQRFANADVQEEKALFRAQVLDNVVLVRQIVRELQNSPNHSFREDALLEGLEEHFSEPEARRQLDTAIDWGRYAELFAYDDDTGELYPKTRSRKSSRGADAAVNKRGLTVGLRARAGAAGRPGRSRPRRGRVSAG